jgi:hypothetical protein
VERDLERRKIGSRFVPRCGGTERVAGWMFWREGRLVQDLCHTVVEQRE